MAWFELPMITNTEISTENPMADNSSHGRSSSGAARWKHERELAVKGVRLLPPIGPQDVLIQNWSSRISIGEPPARTVQYQSILHARLAPWSRRLCLCRVSKSRHARRRPVLTQISDSPSAPVSGACRRKAADGSILIARTTISVARASCETRPTRDI
jgi:hypothetical protein